MPPFDRNAAIVAQIAKQPEDDTAISGQPSEATDIVDKLRSSTHPEPIDPNAVYRTRDRAIFFEAADEITRLRSELDAARAQRDEALATDSRWIIRMSEIREAAGVGHKPMLTELPAAIAAVRAERDALKDRSAKMAKALDYQPRVMEWMAACFGDDITNDPLERAFRFLEEALELAQAVGATEADARALVSYTYDRPRGEERQEVGGVMVCLAALCGARSIDLNAAAEAELARVWTKIDAIRAKHAAKPKGVRSSLPGFARTALGEEKG